MPLSPPQRTHVTMLSQCHCSPDFLTGSRLRNPTLSPSPVTDPSRGRGSPLFWLWTFALLNWLIVGDGERRNRYILCYNPKEAERQAKHRAQIVELLEYELNRHPDKSASAQWAIELLASKRFKRYLSVTKTNHLRMDRSKIREAAKYDGKWVIETNDDTITLEDAACGYKGLMVIERCFRSLKKTQIKMAPMYHWVPRRIETHVRLCVLALLIERVAELSCDKPWRQIREALDRLQVTKFENSSHRFLHRNELGKETTNMLKLLKIPTPKQVLKIEKIA
jgi:transposase